MLALLRDLSVQGIAPGGVTLADLEAYHHAILNDRLRSKPEQTWDSLVWAWNACRREIAGWPAIDIEREPRRKTYILPWAAFPDSYKQDVDQFLLRQSGKDLSEDGPPRLPRPRAGGCMAEAGQAVAQAQTMICGKLLLRPDISRACWKGADLGLSLGEYNIVHLLASNVGRYVTYRAIYDRLHYEGFIAGDGADGYRANVRSAIKRIRNKFRSLDPTFHEIENYNGFGYCWKKPD